MWKRPGGWIPRAVFRAYQFAHRYCLEFSASIPLVSSVLIDTRQASLRPRMGDSRDVFATDAGCRPRLRTRLWRRLAGRDDAENFMLTQEQLLQFFIRQDIPLVGRRMVEVIRSSEPVRRVGGGTHNVVARFASRKMGCVIQAESHKGELPALYTWEYDPHTHEFYDQPSAIKLSYQNATGKRLSHLATPDFFLIQDDWMGWVECKPEDKLQKSHADGSGRYVPDGNGGWRCPPGEAFASEYGLGFRVRSDLNTNWVLVRNLEFLSDYLAPECPVSGEDAQRAVMQAFSAERWMLLGRLLQQEGITADAVFALVAKGGLLVDLEHELLAEATFTNVCRDGLSFEAYRSQKRAQCNQASLPLQKVTLRPGEQVIWDGSPWRILNVGNSDIFLEDDRKVISPLALRTFHELILAGAIKGVPTETDERFQLAEQVIRRASPADLEHAVQWADRLDEGEAGRYSGSSRTLRYWRRRAREGEATYGNRFAGLVTRISARGNRLRKISPQAIQVMNRVIDEEVMAADQPQLTFCYGLVCNQCHEAGAIPPSEKTFRAEIKRRRHEAVALARQGRKAAYGDSEFQWHLDQSTPRHGERPFEVGHIDHTEVDVQLVDSRCGGNLGRPWLTILMDAHTRVILAFFLSFDPPSYRSGMAVIRECVRHHGRIPKTIVVDQGSDFESLYFEALLARMASHKKSRPAAKGRFGSVIERIFGISNQALFHNLAGNNQALQRPRSMVPSHDPRTRAVWTLPALTGAFEDFVDKVYGNRIHPALGTSPRQAMEGGLALSGLREHTLIPYSEEFVRLCMPSTPAGVSTVRPGRGIKIKGIRYWHPVFREPTVERSKVPVLYDPFDVSRAYAFAAGEWVLCRSEYQALFERRTEREIAAISQEIRALHSLAEIRRAPNASDIAAFVSSLRQTEAVLRQQRRDAEQLDDERSATRATPLLPLVIQETEPPADLWPGPVIPDYFEELK